MRKYVETDLKSFMNESQNHKNKDKNQVNESCNCNKKRPKRPTTKSSIATKDGNKKLNESEILSKRIGTVKNEIKNHKFCTILESKYSDKLKLHMMMESGVSATTSKSILKGYNERVNYIKKTLEKVNKLNEEFDMVDDEMDNCDYDFKDRRHGQVETGLYDSAPDIDFGLEESGDDLDDDLGGEIDDDLGDDDLGGDLGDDDLDDDLGDDELDQVGSEIEVKKFVFGVDDIEGAIAELEQLGISASEYTDGGESIESTEVTDDGLGDESIESTEEFISESLNEGEIIIDVEGWNDEMYDKFNGWLEGYGVDPENFFGEDSDVSIEDVPSDDLGDDLEDDDLGGDDLGGDDFEDDDLGGDESYSSEVADEDFEENV